MIHIPDGFRARPGRPDALRALPGARDHVWAQEFASPDGLHVDDAVHPCHRASVDRRLDPESAERVVAPEFAHGFCTLPKSVLG